MTSAVTMAGGAWTRCCQHVCGTDRNICSQAARLRKLTCCLDKWLNHDVSSILEGLGISVNLQFTQHNLCEYMQQHHRTDPASKKWMGKHQRPAPPDEAPPDGPLRNLWHKAAPLLLTPDVRSTWQLRLGDIFLTGTSLLLLFPNSKSCLPLGGTEPPQKTFAIAWIEVQGGGIRFLPWFFHLETK